MLTVKNLTKLYKDKITISDISFDINEGEIFGFIGPNGAGKTTTIKSVVGLLEFDSGEILINNKSIKDNPIECKKEVAYIPDNPDIYESLTGIQYLNFISDVYKTSKEDRLNLIQKYSILFELENALGDLISSYSHGMKQKLVLISALIHKPKLLVLDEPFVGLDPKASFTLKNIMREFCGEGGAIFFSTHVLDVAEKICNKIGIINAGEIKAYGKTSDVTKDKTLENLFMEMIVNE